MLHLVMASQVPSPSGACGKRSTRSSGPSTGRHGGIHLRTHVRMIPISSCLSNMNVNKSGTSTEIGSFTATNLGGCKDRKRKRTARRDACFHMSILSSHTAEMLEDFVAT